MRWLQMLLKTSLLELMLFFPIVLFLYVQLPLGTLTLTETAGLLLAAYMAGCIVNTLLKFKHPFPKTLLGVLLSVGFFLPAFGVTYASIGMMLLALIAVYRGSRLPVTHAAFRLNTQEYILGVFIYFVVSVLHAIHPFFQGYEWIYSAAGMLTLVMTLYLTNRSMVSRETLSGSERPVVEPSVRRNNRIFVGAVIAVVVLIALTYQLQAVFGAALHAVSSWLTALFSGTDAQPQQVLPDQPVQPPHPPLPLGEAKTMAPWVNYLLFGVVSLIAAAGLWLLLLNVGKFSEWLREMRQRFLGLFNREKGSFASGYVDQIERIQKAGNAPRKWRGRAGGERLRWKDLQDNESRVRYLYRRWLGQAVKKGFAHQAHLTPQEIAVQLGQRSLDGSISRSSADALLASYQGVRYGGERPSDEQLQKLADEVGQKKR
ncbi:DUF4129 domain-containing protein [Paenibacillus sp. R14(2021)]|uniref:DUF4129 domain-containing protein n=1 Tax=Paenibacillus sp. R14(2021) TaxID=2859228 RepID=UPI001C613B5F|nr:DUF4129 domain-containing protein [Paenibacillus sp. R14(2021)]